jgi:hypothetical protein
MKADLWILEYLDQKKMLKLLLLIHTPDTSECERGFSQMSFIVTPTRSPLSTNTASGLLFIRNDYSLT